MTADLQYASDGSYSPIASVIEHGYGHDKCWPRCLSRRRVWSHVTGEVFRGSKALMTRRHDEMPTALGHAPRVFILEHCGELDDRVGCARCATFLAKNSKL